MAALDFTDLAVAIAFVTARLTGADADEIETLLVASAATDKVDCCDDDEVATTVYRPYFVAARLLQYYPGTATSRDIKRLRSAAGSEVEYTDPKKNDVDIINQWMQIQAGFDAGYCTIPDSFEAVAIGGAGSAKLVRV